MKIIRLPEPFFGCSTREIGGIYISLVHDEPSAPPDLYIKWVYRNPAGEILPGKFVDKITGEQFGSFMQAFQFNAQPVLQWAIDNGLATGVVEEV
jgi:hypothetical protein